jgi:hypothetical protein
VIRAMSDGELLSIKDRNRRDFRQMLAEMELERRMHADKVRPDRRLAIWELVIAGLSLTVSAIALFKSFGDAAIDHQVEDTLYSGGPKKQGNVLRPRPCFRVPDEKGLRQIDHCPFKNGSCWATNAQGRI